jgi:hypothetical protein
MDEGTNLIVSMFAGTVGLALLVYGKKQTRIPQMVVGLLMMVYPYFMPNALFTGGVAVVLLGGLVLAVRGGL